MKVLVTGGAGYIGSVLLRLLLRKGYDVTCLDRFFFGRDSIAEIADQIRIIQDDVRWFDPAILDGVDAVFDLAALSNDPSGELDPTKTLDINYAGRARVAQLAKKHGVDRYVLASTCSIYGFQPDVLTEASSPNPLTTYAKANLLAEQAILSFTGSSFIPTVLRQATVYGLSFRMRFDLAINGMVRGFYQNGAVPIMRDGQQWRPFVHVKDTSAAFLNILEADPELVQGQTFNVGSNQQNLQIFELAQTVANAIHLPFQYTWYGSPDTRSYRVNFDKIRTTVQFTPHYTPRDGAHEVFTALQEGTLDPDDPKTITVRWYKQLLDMQQFLHNIELNGVLL